MKRLMLSALILILCLTAAHGCAEYYSDTAITVNDTVITPEELETAMNRHLIRSALSLAERGIAFDITDSLNIIDVLDKELFDLEMNVIIRERIGDMDVEGLTPEEEAQAAAQAHEAFAHCREITASENGMAFLPAGDYQPVEDNAEETITRYLASFGLTEEALAEEARWELLEEKLKAAAGPSLIGNEDDDLVVLYAEWLLEWYRVADIRESGTGIAEVVLKLAGK